MYCFTVVWVNVFVNCDQRFGLFPRQGTSYIRVSLGRLTFRLPLGLYRRSVGHWSQLSFILKDNLVSVYYYDGTCLIVSR